MLHKFAPPGWTSLYFHTHVPNSLLTSALGCAMASYMRLLAPVPSPLFCFLLGSIASAAITLKPFSSHKPLPAPPSPLPRPPSLALGC